jgi:hypothetical protein
MINSMNKWGNRLIFATVQYCMQYGVFLQVMHLALTMVLYRSLYCLARLSPKAPIGLERSRKDFGSFKSRTSLV